MSCPVKHRSYEDKPKITKNMIKKNQIYVWKEVAGNPNLYCWIPMSKKIANEEIDINDEEINIQDIPTPENFEDIIENIVEEAEDSLHEHGIKKLLEEKIPDDILVSFDDPKKYNIVRTFIQNKGLKLYGGAAINAYLPKEQKIYNPKDIPDFDFFSPDPWNDATELANILYKNGYKYVEAKAGIHKGTYKVFANLWPVADITYMDQENFDKIRTTNIGGLKIVEPFKLLESMYKEFSLPYSNPSRWPKVAAREKLLTNWIKPFSKKFACSNKLFIEKDHKISEDIVVLLNICYKFCISKKLIFAGNLAYNTLIELGGGKKRVLVDSYEVLSENASNDLKELFELLLKNEKKLEITTVKKVYSEMNNFLYTIYMVKDNEHVKIITIFQIDNCTPYQKISNFYFATVDYLKYKMLESIVFSSKQERKDIKCKLQYLIKIQQEYYKSRNITELDDGPFQRFVIRCRGVQKNSLKTEILDRYLKKLEERKSILKEYTDEYIIKKIPRKKIDPQCVDKPKDLCRYPCAWNHFIGKCQGIPKGIYRPNDRQSFEE